MIRSLARGITRFSRDDASRLRKSDFLEESSFSPREKEHLFESRRFYLEKNAAVEYQHPNELPVSQANAVATSWGRVIMWRAARDDRSNRVMVPMAFVATAPARASPGCTINRCIAFSVGCGHRRDGRRDAR